MQNDLTKKITFLISLPWQPQLWRLILLALIFGLFLASCTRAPKPESAKALATPVTYEDLILYTSAGQFYLTNLAGDQVENFSSLEKSIFFPAVSPDFKQFAFWSNSSGAYELWRYDIKSQRAYRLTFFNDKLSHAEFQNFNMHNAPTWLPNTQSITFSRLGKIWMIESTGYNLETLMSTGTRFSPSWSPDGKKLAFVALDNQSQNLYLWQRTTGEDIPLTNFPPSQHVGSPAWSPDGKQIAFTLSTGDAVDIWTVQYDGTQLNRLTRDGHSNSPAWSPDGNKIAFASGRQDPYLWEIWLMNQDGSSQFCVTRNGGFSPAWLRRDLISPASVASPLPKTKAVSPAMPTKVPANPTPTAIPTVVTSRLISQPALAAVKAGSVPTKLSPKPSPPASPKAMTMAALPKTIPTAAPSPVKTPALKHTPVAPPATPAPQKSATPVSAQKQENYEEYEKYASEDLAILETDELTMESDENRLIFRVKLDFYFAKDLIKTSSLSMLKRLAEMLDKYPEGSLVVENRIRAPKWLKSMLPLLKSLSRARANSVLRHLIVNEKIRQINVTAIGEGDTFPEIATTKEKPVLLVIVE